MSRKYLCSRQQLCWRVEFGGMVTCAEIRATKVGREVVRLVKEESRLIPEPNDVSVETRKGLQMYGCMAIVICMYFVGMYVDYL